VLVQEGLKSWLSHPAEEIDAVSSEGTQIQQPGNESSWSNLPELRGPGTLAAVIEQRVENNN